MQQQELIERQAPSQQAKQKDRFAKACPNARDVQGDDQHVHKATWPPLAVRVTNYGGAAPEFSYQRTIAEGPLALQHPTRRGKPGVWP